MKYSKEIMGYLRKRLGLKEDDASKDRIINLYTASEAFEEVMMWHGIYGYDTAIKEWISNIYGIKLP